MRIEFIWFNLSCAVNVSTGLSILSSELSRAGHEMKILHLNERIGLVFDIERIKKITVEFNPQLIGLSFGSNHFHYIKRLAPILKSSFPDAKIICGGVHTTLKPEEVIQVDGVDFIFIGEADGYFVDFVDRLQNGIDYEKMNSVWIKKNGKIIRNPMAPFPDISNQAFLDFNNILDSDKFSAILTHHV